MNKRRLLKLADLLEADAKNKKGIRFDLEDWGRTTNSDKIVSCGTIACAAGLAAISGAFKRSGLWYELRPLFERHYEIKITLDGQCKSDGSWDGSFVSIREFFKLKNNEAEWLFIPSSYEGIPIQGAKGKRTVAKRIRKLVNRESRAVTVLLGEKYD